MSFDADRIEEHQLPDGTCFDVYAPKRSADRLLVSVLPVVDGILPRRAGVETASVMADQYGYLILSPGFGYESGFQTLGINGPVRHDLLLLEMIGHVASRYQVAVDRVSLFGYSAGGQFAHRFLYCHPNRVEQIAIGAPGTVTLADPNARWPLGVADLVEVAGNAFDLEAMRRPRIQLFVGEQDNDPNDESLARTAESDVYGSTRLERARRLHAAWIEAGIRHEYVEIPDADHASVDLGVAWKFLTRRHGTYSRQR